MPRLILAFCISITIGVTDLIAQTPYPENAWGKVHQFDFWLGDWDVYMYDTDSLVAYSQVVPIVDSIGLQEHYESSNGGSYSSTSISKYNFSKDQWEQYYINNQGFTLRLLGNLIDGEMVVENRKDFKNRPSYNKITWEPRPDGSIRHTWIQRWEDEKDWKTVFDSEYRRRIQSAKKKKRIQKALVRYKRFNRRHN